MKKTIRTLRSMGFKAASKGDQAFADMHPVQVVDAHDEKVSKTLQDIADAKGVIPYDRVANKHGYRKGEDEAAYDSFKHNAGGPVVAPVYTKPMYEGVRSCTSCFGKGCDYCGETGYALLGEEQHGNAIVRALRRNLNEETISEASGLRLVKTFTAGPHAAKVYKDREWGEYRVQFHKDGKHLKKADSHHDDRDDAFGTAQHQLKRMAGVNEDVELDEGFAAAHNRLQDNIRNFAQSLPGRAKAAASDLKRKAIAAYNDAEDRYQGGPQRRAMQAAKAVKAKKDQQVARITGKASGYENKAKDLTSYASQHLAKADSLKRAASQIQVPQHNMHQVTTTDDYERKKAEIAAATTQKGSLSAAAQDHLNKGLSTYDAADASASRAARIKSRLDAALAGKSKLLGRGKPKPTAFQSRLKKTVRSV